MAIMDNHDQDMALMNHLWTIISELSEQLSQNRSVAVSLYGQADAVNVSPPSETHCILLMRLMRNRVRLFMEKLDLYFGGVCHREAIRYLPLI